MNLFVHVAVAPLLLVLAACSANSDAPRQPAGDTTGSAATGTVTTPAGTRACDLLSAADFTSITGASFETGVTTNDYMGSSQCRYARPGAASGGAMVALHQQGDIANYRNVPGSSVVGGVGDSAVWNRETAQLAVRRGDAVFSISLFARPARREWAVQLARVALTKLAPK